ncbi:MAG: hypothetical protein RL481_869 [Pseudomonadota bacterium]
MPEIGIAEIKAAYDLSCEVAEGKLTYQQAVEKLRHEYEMNPSSAQAYLRKRQQLLEGCLYTRTMSIAATQYFLEHIYKDKGQAGLRAAIQSVRAHAAYYKKQGKSGLPTITALVDELERKHLAPVSVPSETDWQEQVEASYNLDEKVRQKQLPPQGHKPKKLTTVSYSYARNPHVVAERLRIANGHCEDCGEPAPFISKKTGLPFLEVHHRVTLADNGDDTVENAIALCPNCHRRHHYG